MEVEVVSIEVDLGVTSHCLPTVTSDESDKMGLVVGLYTERDQLVHRLTH